MELTPEQIEKLLKLVASCHDDNLDCDGCLERISEYVETELSGRELCETMQEVKGHLKNCHCCELEYQALLEALKGLEGETESV